MNTSNKTSLQILFVLLIVAVVLVGLSFIATTDMEPAFAQEPPVQGTPALNTFSEETLAAYGLSIEDIEAALTPLNINNIEVSVSVNPASIPNGRSVTFTTTITNQGPGSVQYLLFSRVLPSGMAASPPTGTTLISNGLNPPTWLLPNPITPTGSVEIIITGTINTQCGGLSPYTANVAHWSSIGSKQASANINVNTGINCLFLPLVHKDPTPTPNPILFFDDFSTKQWTTYTNNDCVVSYENSEYQIKANKKAVDCFGAAPTSANQKFGTFKVKARRETGSSNFTVALYTNGGGGKTYYALEVRPGDNCGWKLIRRKESDNNGNPVTEREGGCDAAIKRNSESNILELRHASNGDISVFVNNTQLGATWNDGAQLTTEGDGVYARTDDDTSVTVRFDDFTVIRP